MTSASIISKVFRNYRMSLALLVLFGFVGAILDGIGINMLVPFISFLTGGGGQLDAITRATQHAFAFFGISFQFRNILIFMAVLFIARAIALIIFSYIRARISANFLERESSALFRGTLTARWPYLLSLEGGYIQNTLFWDVKRAANLLDVVAQSVQSWSGCVVYLVIAFVISPLVTGITVAAGIIFLIFFRPLIRRSRTLAEETSRAEKQFSQHSLEHIAGLKNIKASGKEVPVYELAETYVHRLADAIARSALVQSMGTVLVQPFSFIFMLGVFALTYTSGTFSLAGFAATIYLIQKIFTYLQSGQASLHSINELTPFAENVLRYKETIHAEREDSTVGSAPFSFTDTLAFENVSFAHPDRPAVLNSVSFTVPRGSVLALIGPSGGGKTTIADLLVRLFEPTSGRITLDGIAATDISLQAWRERIGYVTQDAFMRNASVRENIRFYRPEITDAQIIEAAKRANVHEVILALSDGYDTTIGDRGMLLSGGQRQRVALARALAGDPALLILDEATSALDADSERLIQEAIESLHGSLTVVVIAHRLHTVEHADRILVLEAGHITESGSPEELQKNPDSYFAARYRAEVV